MLGRVLQSRQRIAGTPRLLAFCLCLTLIASAVIGHVTHQVTWLEPNDDQLYLFSLSTRFIDPARYEQVAAEVGMLVRARADGWRITRYDLRDQYRNNYTGISYFSGFVFQNVSGVSFAERAAKAWSISAALVTGLALLMVLVALALARDLRLLAAVALTAVVVVIEGLLRIDAGNRLVRVEPGMLPNPLDIISKVAMYVVDPGNSSFLFGAAPRCVFILLLLAVFLFRWQSRPTWAYWLFLPMALVHQSYAGFFLVVVIGLDVVLRPRSLMRPGVVAPILLAAALFVFRDRLWLALGPGGPIAIGIGILALAGGVLLARYWMPSSYAWLGGVWSRTGGRLRTMPQPIADFVLLIAGWTAFLLLTIIGNYLATLEQSTLFWGHSAGRMLGAIRPVLFVALIYSGLVWLQQLPQLKRAAPPAAAALILLLLPVAYLRWPPAAIGKVVDRNASIMAEIDARLGRKVSVIESEHEGLLYYGIAKSVVTGEDALREQR